MSRLGRLIAGTVVGVLMAVLLAALVEGGARVAGRLRDGQWPQTYAERTHADAVHRSQLYLMHPYLNAAPRPGASSTVNGRRASFNSSGYRSVERPRAKPDGVRRVLTVGGSTTFDLLADDDPHTWPAQLEALLTADGERVEVWNAGFPGWTSAEMMRILSWRNRISSRVMTTRTARTSWASPPSVTRTPMTGAVVVGSMAVISGLLGTRPLRLGACRRPTPPRRGWSGR